MAELRDRLAARFAGIDHPQSDGTYLADIAIEVMQADIATVLGYSPLDQQGHPGRDAWRRLRELI